ncbi:acyl-CoA thioesterase [Sphingomonas sp. CL5.1]|uniref:acyl-CoA thioesterase n=1 Tax=Sphingomonas sp. CL5.1 TaxID=2653203 RepID=UPI0015824D94|nr:thioesterase family protein [Sphingomonas sp. CL5.1]QKR99864.1 acyl-CoA thioesterase [Sphingomonas sp. CL5.1]
MTAEFAHFHSFRVRFAEVDAQAVVFNSRYLEYADIVLTEFMRAADVPILGPDSFEMHVVQANVQYRQPLRLDDAVEGWMRIDRIGRSSIAFEVELRPAGTAMASAVIVLHYVHVDLATGKSAEIPPMIRARLESCPAGR